MAEKEKKKSWYKPLGRSGGKIPKPGEAHPTTADIEYSEADAEFLKAIEKYKTDNHEPFPTYCEILRVLLSLGYSKPSADDGMAAKNAQEDREIDRGSGILWRYNKRFQVPPKHRPRPKKK